MNELKRKFKIERKEILDLLKIRRKSEMTIPAELEISNSSYRRRMREGWTLEQMIALETILNIERGALCDPSREID